MIPTIIMLVLLLDGLFNPLKVDLDRLNGKVVFRACFEGTQNGATLKLREGNKFDILWTGVLTSSFFYGDYDQVGDTLFLNYHGLKPKRFGEIIHMDNENEFLIPIDKNIDSLKYVVSFYYGHCKGLN